MLDHDKRTAILSLHKEGHPVRKIAKDLQVSRNSVRDVLRSGQSQVPGIERLTPLDAHVDKVRALYVKCQGNLVRVHEELALQHQVSVAYATLTRFCRDQRIHRPDPDRVVRIVTGPGEEMQHDTSPYTIEVGGKSVKRQCASLVFGYSRRLYIRFYPRFDRFTCKSFLTEAFRSMGGTCRRCVIDNTSVILACGAGVSAQVAPELEAFEKRFGFRFLAHEINRPNRKGKVERPFWYVEKNFLAGRTFKDDADLNAQALLWLEKTANVRRLRELGASPQELFAAESASLVPLPLYIPEVYVLHQRDVDAYGDIHLHDRMYSTPLSTPVGRELSVRETEKEVVLLDGSTELARHPNLTYSTQHESVLPAHARPRRHHKAPDVVLPQEAALRTLGPEAVHYLDQLKTQRPGRAYRYGVKVIHRLIGHYPGPDILRAMAQALEHRLWDVKRIESVLLQNLAQSHFQLPLIPPEDFEKNPEFEKGAATPPPDLNAFKVDTEDPEGPDAHDPDPSPSC